MVGLLVVVIIIVLVVLGVVAFGLKRSGRAAQEQVDHLSSSPRTLRYTVPAGQDPAVVLAALHEAGYTAAQDPSDTGLGGGTDVLIDREDGVPDRESVRTVLDGVRVGNLEGDPAPDTGIGTDRGTARFADE